MVSTFVDDDGSPVAFDCPDEAPDPEILYLQKKKDRLLLSELEQLAPANRAAIEVCDLQQQSTVDAAVILGVSVAALKSRRSRGRAALRRKLEPQISRQCA
ncbi:MAG TPA: sigma factor-like helix-turn-helix DNA-binding protein [Acidobacteriaceae bacterium]|jgi:DNA-directed RNA polymerase specialized sigma24 family protein|nr:sigma factor-like helix-turn-helix DNA-binding protein [Acidobacteriaceae bacterium]